MIREKENRIQTLGRRQDYGGRKGMCPQPREEQARTFPDSWCLKGRGEEGRGKGVRKGEREGERSEGE